MVIPLASLSKSLSTFSSMKVVVRDSLPLEIAGGIFVISTNHCLDTKAKAFNDEDFSCRTTSPSLIHFRNDPTAPNSQLVRR